MRFFLSLLTVLVLSLAVRAADPLPQPKKPMPTLVYATASEKEGIVTVQMYQYVQKVVAEKVKVKEGDQEVERTVYKTFVVPDEQKVEVDGTKIKAVRVNGKAVDPKELPKLLEKSTAILLSDHGDIDPYFAPVYKPATVVILRGPQQPPK